MLRGFLAGTAKILPVPIAQIRSDAARMRSGPCAIAFAFSERCGADWYSFSPAKSTVCPAGFVEHRGDLNHFFDEFKQNLVGRPQFGRASH